MPLIAPEQITSHCETGSWRRLEQVALALVRDASERAGPPLRPLLGGGTRLMLALQHRISHDIDLFIRDPHWLGYLSPRLNDRFENQISAYDETAISLKLKLCDGEIDFIIAMQLLDLPSTLGSHFIERKANASGGRDLGVKTAYLGLKESLKTHAR